jgi:ATP-dependent Clp protease adaptor protein ClpS
MQTIADHRISSVKKPGTIKEGGPGAGSGNVGTDAGAGVATKTRAKSKKPAMFKVLMLNDDYTPMEFVVMVLRCFQL